MQTQEKRLRAVQPRNTVDGFDVEVIRKDYNLLTGQKLAKNFGDNFIQINASCNGRNPYYPRPSSLTLLVTKYASPDESIGITSQTDVGIIVLGHTQSLSAAGIFEIRTDNKTSIVLILWIENSKDESTSTAVYTLAHKKPLFH
jgi:hypothetical protein